jgi:hypothetical protein
LDQVLRKNALVRNYLLGTMLLWMLVFGLSLSFAHQSGGARSNDAQSTKHTATPTATPINTELLRSGSYQEIIAELQSLEIIPQGGSIVYQTQYAFYDGQGANYTPLAAYQPHTNVVVAGELSFRPGESDELQLCMIGSRMTEVASQAMEFLFVGIDDQGDVLFIDRTQDRRVPETAFALTDLNLDVSHEFLIIVYQDELALYVDGERVLQSEALNVREGTYGIALASDGFGGRCEVRDFWIYELDLVWDGADGVCGITVNRPVNLRSGPGTSFNLAGEIDVQEVMSVVAQTEGVDGYIWWQLTDQRWVRSDLVRELGDCEKLAPLLNVTK